VFFSFHQPPEFQAESNISQCCIFIFGNAVVKIGKKISV